MGERNGLPDIAEWQRPNKQRRYDADLTQSNGAINLVQFRIDSSTMNLGLKRVSWEEF